MLSFGVDVFSMYFSYEEPLNKIIVLYDSKPNLNDGEIKDI